MSGPVDERPRTPAGGDVGATLREMWETRPARRGDDRKVAGVAAAVARRYAVDPTLVRIGFVVAAFYGVGLLAYLVGWMVLPRLQPDGSRRETPAWVVVAAVLVALTAIGPLFGGRPGGVIGVLAVLALLYALHRSRGDHGTPAATGAEVSSSVSSEASSGSASPPAWDPLGAAPFAWDLPDPSTAPAPERRSRIVALTLGLAVLAAATVLALGLLGVLPLGVTPVAATALGVVGLGLVVGSVLGGARRLMVAAVPLAILLVIAAGAGPRFGDEPWDGRWNGPPWADDGDRTTSAGIGDQRWEPRSAFAVAPRYQVGMGRAELDLSSVYTGGPVRTAVEVGAGDARVEVPETADITAVCTTGAGEVDCLGRPGGPAPVVDFGPDGPGGPVFDLRVTSGAGDVEVTR